MEHKKPVAIGSGKQQKQDKKPQIISILLVALISGIFGSYFIYQSFAATPGASIFMAECLNSHTSNDDPIVFPGQTGAAHSHEFTGAWSTDAFSTTESLLKSQTSCFPFTDKSAYWSPTLYQNGKPIKLLGTVAYYGIGAAQDNKTRRDNLQAYPPGLRMIADMKNSIGRLDVGGWSCGGNNIHQGFLPGPNIQPCPIVVESFIGFPDCWDGKNLDSADHRSHVAFSLDNADCPPSHPVYIPRLELKNVYDTKGEGGGFTVASGGKGATTTNGATITSHADFFNAWDQPTLEYLVRHCIKEGRAVPDDGVCLKPKLPYEQLAAQEAKQTNPNRPRATQPDGSSSAPVQPTPTPAPSPSPVPSTPPPASGSDTTKPNAPENLKAVVFNATTVKLSWNASADNGPNSSGVAKYNVSRKGIVIAQVTGTSYTDDKVSPNSDYAYSVQAVDVAGNISGNSGSAYATTPNVSDTTSPPAQQRNLLTTNQTLSPGQQLTDTTNGYRLILQPDGNLVLYDKANKPRWHTITHGTPASKLILQSDGNLVLYTSSNKPVWSIYTGRIR